MGNAMSNQMIHGQREFLPEMLDAQLNNMMRGQDRMMNLQIATQVAFARERFQWMAAFWCAASIPITALAITKNPAIRFAALPYLGFSTLTAYTYDLAYGTKVERIFAMRDEIFSELHAYTPTLPNKDTPRYGVKQ